MAGKKEASFFDDLVGLELHVPWRTWDEKALKCFGNDFHQKSIQGFVTRVKWNRQKSVPFFDVNFQGKKGYKDFYGLDLDYVLSYSDDLPFKYHTLKAEFIVRISKEASIQKSPDEMKAGTEDMESLDDESEDKCI